MLRTTGGVATVVLAALVLSGCSGAAHTSSAQQAKRPAANRLIVMIGDSIMRGYGLPPSDLAWPQLLADDRGLTIDNLACDGAGFLAVGAPTECNSNYESIVMAAIDLHPGTVFIEGSDNDFGQDSDALATATARQIQQLRAALPHATIIGLSTISGAAADPAQLAAVNSQVRAAINSVHGRYLTIGQPYSGNAAWMQDDQEHPTSAGQLAIKQAVEQALDAAGITLR